MTRTIGKNVFGKYFYSWALCVLLIVPSFNFYLNEITQRYMGKTSVSPLFYGVLVVLSLIVYFKFITERRGSILIVLWLLFFLLVGNSYFNYPTISEFILSRDNDPLKSWLIYTPAFLIPISIAASKCCDWRLMLKIMYPLSCFTIITGLLSYYLVVFVKGKYLEVNYMVYSYNMLMSFCCTFIYAVSFNNIKALVLSLSAFLTILLVGARGALVWSLLFFFIVIYEKIKTSGHLIFGMSVLFVVLLFIASFFTVFSESALSFLDDYHATSRVLTKITEGNFSSSEGRDAIGNVVIDAITERPILGYGLFGDRYVLNQVGLSGYAHNIVTELMCDFGVFIGPLIFIIILLKLYNLYRLKKTDFHRIYLILLPSGFFMLFVSGSFIEEWAFWAIVGFIFNKKLNDLSYGEARRTEDTFV